MTTEQRISSTLIETLHLCAQSEQFVYVVTNSQSIKKITYAELYNSALEILGALQLRGVQEGAEVILQCQDYEIFITSLWACVLGGLIPVPLAVGTNRGHRKKLVEVSQTLPHSSIIACERGFRSLTNFENDNLQEHILHSIKSRMIHFQDLLADRSPGKEADRTPDDLAFIQFSSGSTGSPKGVTLTNRNITVNVADAIAFNNYVRADHFLSWVPLTHDLGMIGFHLGPMIAGCSHTLINTQAFVRNPSLWMGLASSHKATVLCSPNFGYQHFLKMHRAKHAYDWDLSSVRILINGAEPISCDLARQFTRTLAPYGLSETAMKPAYGMAESTLYTTITAPAESQSSICVNRTKLGIGSRVEQVESSADNSLEIANVGKPLKMVQVRITDNHRNILQDSHVGNIEIKGENVTSGYYKNADATSEKINAEGWLLTGDIGFLINRSLFVTGRSKDVIFSGGMNFYPHDIETVAQEIDGVELNKVVACGTTDPETGLEKVLVFVRFKKSMQQFLPIARKLENHLLKNLDLHIDHIIPLAEQIPKTTSGKIQRFQLASRFLDGEFDHLITLAQSRNKDSMPQFNDCVRYITEQLHEISEVGDVDPNQSLMEQGVSSKALTQLHSRICKHYEQEHPISLVFDYPGINALAAYLSSSQQNKDIFSPRVEAVAKDEPIAIVSIALRLPGGINCPASYLDAIRGGTSAITSSSDERNVPDSPRLQQKFKAGYLGDITSFDNAFFGISPREAEQMDPQQRLLLEVCWEACERAGYSLESLENMPLGVFAGYTSRQHSGAKSVSQYSITAESASVAVGRISYFLGVQGPNMAIDTACSSSLVAVHNAINSIRGGECSAALCGGINLLTNAEEFLTLEQMQALSPTGSCRTFDHKADGYVRGEGAAIIMLKPLSKALEDGNHIHALINGSALNHDGRSNGLTAPSRKAQTRLIQNALSRSGINAEQVGYIEAHGTGTPLGDPIELQALSDVFDSTPERTKKYVGSVKTQIGHLETAAGIAGLCRAALAIEHAVIPPSLNCENPTMLFKWKSSCLEVSKKSQPWETQQNPRIASVSSFGFSGTNAHVILSEAPEPKTPQPTSQVETQILTLSARTPHALAEHCRNFSRYLQQTATPLGLITAQAAQKRTHFNHRIALCHSDKAELTALLAKNPLPEGARGIYKSGTGRRSRKGIVMMFSGQGSQYQKMGSCLYKDYAPFRETLDYCSSVVQKQSGHNILELLYSEEDCSQALQQTEITQPLLVSFELALYEFWKSLGIRPSVVLGHSIGEYTACAVAGAISYEDALTLAVVRGKLLQDLPHRGGMLAAQINEDELNILLKQFQDVTIAAHNGPGSFVVSGDLEKIEQLRNTLKAKGVRCKQLAVSHAFHSSHVDEVLAPFGEHVKGIRFGDLKIPLLSLRTATFIDNQTVSSAEHWRRHLREAVLYCEGIKELLASGYRHFIELGPGTTLTGMAQQICTEQLEEQDEFFVIATQKKNEPFEHAHAIAQVYANGYSLNWHTLQTKVSHTDPAFPCYPFEKHQFPPHKNAVKSQTTVPAPMTTTNNTTPQSPDNEEMFDKVISIICEISGFTPEQIQPDQNLFHLGLDSLLVVQTRQVIQKRFSVKIDMNRFFSELDTVSRIVDYLEKHAPKRVQTMQTPAPADTTGTVSQTPGSLETIFSQQLAAMNSLVQQQLAVLGGQYTQHDQKQLESTSTQAEYIPSAVKSGPAQSDKNVKHGPYKTIKTQTDRNFNVRQQSHLDALVERYTTATNESKLLAQSARSFYANSRSIIGFKPEMKEMIYPVSVARAEGARIWDVNNREYVDITMGFGVTMFGHSPDFVREAVEAELARGAAVGPMSSIAGKVAEKICAMGRVDRAAFFTTGTEAIMAGIRIARMVSNRDKIVIFQDGYHGSFDGVLAAGGLSNGEPFSFPIAPGTPQNLVDDVIVLPYGQQGSLDLIDRLGDTIGLVLVEPVASRKPALQPREFLQQLRQITRSHNSLLLFDEIILGFRIHPGGAQAWFDIEADLVTYGKVLGGGLPIGVLSGKRSIMDAVDGGAWQYGDDSVPGKKTAFVAGTYNNHPLSLAACLAVLEHLEQEGPQLQELLNARTQQFCERLKRYFEAEEVPIEVPYFGSLFRFEYPVELEIFNYHLLDNNVYVWEGKNCFLSTAHTDADLEWIFTAVQRSVEAMRSGGFLPPKLSKRQKYSVPLSDEQKSLWFATRQSEMANLAYQEVINIKLPVHLDNNKLRTAYKTVVERHHLLNVCGIDGKQQLIDPLATPVFEVRDESGSTIPAARILEENLQSQATTTLMLESQPLVRMVLLLLPDSTSHILCTVHHIIADGWSLGVLLSEIAQLYSGILPENLPEPGNYFDYLDRDVSINPEISQRASHYWNTKIENCEVLGLPTQIAAGKVKNFAGKRLRLSLEKPLVERIREFTTNQGVSESTLFNGLFRLWLSGLSSQRKFSVGIPLAAHPSLDKQCLIGQCSTVLPFVMEVDRSERLHDYLKRTQTELLEAVAFEAGLEELRSNNTSDSDLLVTKVLCNIDKSFDLQFGKHSGYFDRTNIAAAKCDIFLNLINFDTQYLIDLDYNTSLFQEDTICVWWDIFCTILETALSESDISIAKLLAGNTPDLTSQLEVIASDSLNASYTVEVFKELTGKNKHDGDKTAFFNAEGALTYHQLMAWISGVAAKLEHTHGKNSPVGIFVPSKTQQVIAVTAALSSGLPIAVIPGKASSPELQQILESGNFGTIISSGSKAEMLKDSGYQQQLLLLDQIQPNFHRAAYASAPRYTKAHLLSFDLTNGAMPRAMSTSTLLEQLEALQSVMPTETSATTLFIDDGSSNEMLFCVMVLHSLLSGATFAHFELEHSRQCVVALENTLSDKGYDRLVISTKGWNALEKLCIHKQQKLKESRIMLCLDLDCKTPDLSEADFNMVAAFFPHQFSQGYFSVDLDKMGSADGLCLTDIQVPHYIANVDAPTTSAWTGVFGELFIQNSRNQFEATGLRARLLPNHAIEIAGHYSNLLQSKIQLELLQRKVLTHPDILFGQVIPIHDQTGLIFVPVARNSFKLAKLHQELQTELRKSMCPNQYSAVQSMTDEVSASTWQQVTLEAEELGATERNIRDIWQRILQLAEISSTDNFFNLGGQSIHAARMVNEIHATLGVQLELSDVFTSPTIKQLAIRVENHDASLQTGRIAPMPKSDLYPTSNAQRRLWLMEQLEPGLIAYTIPLVLESQEQLDISALQTAFARLHDRHEVFRTCFEEKDGVPFQKVNTTVEPCFKFIDATDSRVETVSQQILEAVQEPFDLSKAPLVKLSVFKMQEDPAFLCLIAIHHIISDGYSMAVLAEELCALYKQCSLGEEAHLTPLGIQYKDYAVWQQRQLDSGKLIEEKSYWINKLKGRTAPLDMPSDFPRPEEKTYVGCTSFFRIGKEETAGVRALSDTLGITNFAFLTASLKLLLFHYTAQSEITIGTVISGRDHTDLINQIGFFVNNLVLHDSISSSSSYKEVLEQCAATLAEAYQHQHYPFDLLVDDLDITRDPGRNPLFDVMIVSDDRDTTYENLQRAGFRERLMEFGTSQFDLTFYLTQEADDILVALNYNSDIFSSSTISQLSQRFRQLIQEINQHPSAPVGEARWNEDSDTTPSAPLSFHQERLWFVDAFEKKQLYTDSPVYYNMGMVLQIPGNLALNRLNSALNHAIECFPVACSKVLAEGEKIQQVLSAPRPVISVNRAAVDLDHSTTFSEEHYTLIDQYVSMPFDLSEGPLFRLHVLIDQHSNWSLVVSAHHIIVDQAALAAFCRQLMYAYCQTPSELPAVTGETTDFYQLAIQEREASEQTYEKDCNFWKNEITAAHECLQLPLDNPRPAIHTYTGGTASCMLTIHDRINELAQRVSCRTESVYFAAYQYLLMRYSGQSSLICGVPWRTKENTFGPISNLLPVRSEASSEITVADWIKTAENNLNKAREHGQTPFDLIVRAVNPQNDMSRTALFDVLFRYEEKTAEQDGSITDLNFGWGKYDINMLISVQGNQTKAIARYNLDILNQETMLEFVHCLENVLESMTSLALETSMMNISLYSTAEIEQKWTSAEPHSDIYPQDDTLVSAFREAVRQHPDNTALIHGEHRLSYQQLDEQAECIAKSLLNFNLEREAKIAVLMNRSTELVAVFLGILKAGAAYVPLDPADPRERLGLKLEDSHARLTITTTECGELLDGFHCNPVMFQDLIHPDEHTRQHVLPEISPDQLAYMIYTSGSTGKPKGVMVEHRNVIALLRHKEANFNFSSTDSWTMLHSPCFDFSVWEMYGALLFGGALHIIPVALARDPESFYHYLSTQKITVLNSTPAYFYKLAEVDAESLSKLQTHTVIFGGEALNPSLLAEFKRKNLNTRLINMFGITETTVHVSFKELSERDVRANNSVIGTALPHLGMLLLDEQHRPVPRGVVGEICVLGHGVSRGYHEREPLQQEKFITTGQNTRAYLSGDLGRELANGDIIYCGRKDRQVKIRGYRIEIADVEHALSLHSCIERVVIVSVDGELIAYIKGHQTTELSGRELRKFLTEKLPDYMVPAAFFVADTIPLNHNGKTDVENLRETATTRLSEDSGEQTPLSGQEKQIADIFIEVLDLKQVSREDNFFELGGHSLKATQVVSRIRKQLQVQLSLKDFFRYPTIEQLAEHLGGEEASQEQMIQPLPLMEAYPASHAQKRMWITSQKSPSSLAYSCYIAFMAEGQLNLPRLAEAFKNLQSRHESLRTIFKEEQGQPYQLISQQPLAEMQTVFLHKENESGTLESARAYIRQDCATAFDLTQGPLIRFAVLVLEEKEDSAKFVLSFNLHHIISDGWSAALMCKEFMQLYEDPLCLAPLEINYKDYAAWHKDYIESAAGHRDLQFWKQQLSEKTFVPASITTDFPRPQIKQHRGEDQRFTFSPQEHERILKFCQQNDCTLFMFLVSLVNAALYLRTGKQTLSIGAPIAGRDNAQLESQIGFYVNTLPLITRIEEQDDFVTLLGKVKATSLDAFAHSRCPLDLMLEQSDLVALPGEHPLFNTIVILQNNESLELSCNDFNCSTFMEESFTSKFDLNFMFEEQDSLQTILEYDTDLYLPETVEIFLQEFATITEQVLQNPEIPLKDFPLQTSTPTLQTEEEFLKSCLNVSDTF